MSDKQNLAQVAEGLTKLGYSLVSTGGSARSLQQSGLRVIQVDELTGFPEMLDGKVGFIGMRHQNDWCIAGCVRSCTPVCRRLDASAQHNWGLQTMNKFLLHDKTLNDLCDNGHFQ